jgi:hypothetical protein
MTLMSRRVKRHRKERTGRRKKINSKQKKEGTTVPASLPTFLRIQRVGSRRSGRTGSVLQQTPKQWERVIKYR